MPVGTDGVVRERRNRGGSGEAHGCVDPHMLTVRVVEPVSERSNCGVVRTGHDAAVREHLPPQWSSLAGGDHVVVEPSVAGCPVGPVAGVAAVVLVARGCEVNATRLAR